MLVNILSSEIKEWAIILTVKTVGFLARMVYNLIYYNLQDSIWRRPDGFCKISGHI